MMHTTNFYSAEIVATTIQDLERGRNEGHHTVFIERTKLRRTGTVLITIQDLEHGKSVHPLAAFIERTKLRRTEGFIKRRPGPLTKSHTTNTETVLLLRAVELSVESGSSKSALDTIAITTEMERGNSLEVGDLVEHVEYPGVLIGVVIGNSWLVSGRVTVFWRGYDCYKKVEVKDLKMLSSARVAQPAEHSPCKREVAGSIPAAGSTLY